MFGSLLSLFIPIPTLAAQTSAGFALMGSAMAAAVLGMWQMDPKRHVDLRWLAFGIGVFLVYSLITTMPTWAGTEWMSRWGALAFLGNSACIAFALAIGTWAVVRYGYAPLSILQAVIAVVVSVSLVMALIPGLAVPKPYVGAYTPFGLFYSSRIAAFWCVLGFALGNSVRVQSLLFLVVMFMCGSVSAWIALAAVLAIRLAGTEWEKYAIVGLALVVILALSRSPLAYAIQNINLRIRNWGAVLTSILDNPCGIGSNPIAYATELGHRGLPPHATSDVLGFAIRCGWLALVAVASAFIHLIRNKDNSREWQALVAVSIFALIQTSVSHSHNAMLAWFVLCAWLIKRSENGTEAIKA